MAQEIKGQNPPDSDKVSYFNFLNFNNKLTEDYIKTVLIPAFLKAGIFKEGKKNYGMLDEMLGKYFDKLRNKTDNRYSSRFVNNYLKSLFNKISSSHLRIFKKRYTNATGETRKYDFIDSQQAIKLKISENIDLVTNINEDNANRLKKLFTDSITKGYNRSQLVKEVAKLTGKTSRRAKFIVNNEIENTYAFFNKERLIGAGIKYAVWKSHIDSKTRPAHLRFNNKKYKIGLGLYNSDTKTYEEPGFPYGCRCWNNGIVPKNK